jgi:hypothetical protein
MKEVTENLLVDELGELYHKAPDGELTSLTDITIESEKIQEEMLEKLFPGSLANDNDMVYLRRKNGTLHWVSANRMEGGGTAKWKSLSPTLSMKLEKQSQAEVEPPPYEITRDHAGRYVSVKEILPDGWYQDLKGDLYQLLNGEWTGETPKDKSKIEYLG